MRSHTQFARLSQPAMTSQHGRLLQDSGFTRLDLPPSLSEDWALTIMSKRDVSSFLYGSTGTVTGRLSSGRPAIQNIPRAEPSTSARQLREIASMYSIEELRDALRSALQKTYSLPSRSEPPKLLMDTRVWERCYPNTPLPSCYEPMPRSICGLIPTKLGSMRPTRLRSSLNWWDLSQYESLHQKIPSAIALRRYGE
jgi:hypothetical protein